MAGQLWKYSLVKIELNIDMTSDGRMIEKLQNFDCDSFSLQGRQLVDFKYSSGTLSLVLTSDKEGMIKVVFDWVHSFRVTDEGDLLKMLDELNGQMTTGVYIVGESNYLSWFNEQSFSIHDDESINHYLIVTGDDVIDVLSSVSPMITSC